MLTLYEFSTGINIQQDPNGKWFSTGYLNGWMHNTYSSDNDIPHALQSAYDNQEFAVDEDNRSQLTAIARVLKTNNQQWSVITFLTYAQDDKNRPVPTYRFFFSEGNSILDILRRIITFEAQHQALPIFHPFEPTNLNQYTPADLSEINSKIPRDSSLEEEIRQEIWIKTHVLRENATLVDKSHALSLFNLNRLALQRASAIGEAGNTSWAYNADRLHHPETYILIQACDRQAYTYLQSKCGSEMANEETTIRTALRKLIDNDKIDPEAPNNLKIIATAINQDPHRFTETYLFSLGLPRTQASLNIDLNNQNQPELIKLGLLLSLFFPHILEQLKQWQDLAEQGWLQFITTYTAKVKTTAIQAKLTHLLTDPQDEIPKYVSDQITYNPPNEYIIWVLTKSLWANPKTESIYKQQIYQPLSIQIALRELTETEDIEHTAQNNLKLIATARQNLHIDEQYIRDIAQTLGFTDHDLNNQPNPQLIKLHIILSLFFPDVKAQLAQWQILANLGWSEVIATYTIKIKNYIAAANLSRLLQEANNEIIHHCFTNINFNSSDQEPSNSESIVWTLTNSLWANDSTLELFERIIRSEVETAFELSQNQNPDIDLNQDFFKLQNYLRILQNNVTIGRGYRFRFIWQLWDTLNIYFTVTESNQTYRQLKESIPRPERHYHQLADVLDGLKQVDHRFGNIHNFFNTVNQSFEGILVRILPADRDIFDRLQTNQQLLNRIEQYRYLALINLAISGIFYIHVFFVGIWVLSKVLELTIGFVKWVYSNDVVQFSLTFSLIINVILATILFSKKIFPPKE
jgi:hypothetical protein